MEQSVQGGATAPEYYLLQIHDGTYTGSGVVYDAATGTIRQGGGITDPEPTPDPEPSADQPSSWAAGQVDEAVSEIDDNVQRLLAQAMKDATEENLRAQVAQEEDDLEDTAEFGPVGEEEDHQEEIDRDTDDDDDEDADPHPPRGSRIDFGELQFGRDYEIK